MQKPVEKIGVTSSVKRELERRKRIKSKRKGRAVSFDEVVRDLLGWE